MKRFSFFLFMVLGLLLLQIASCKEDAKKVLETTPVEFKKEGELSLYNAATDSLLAKLDIEVAETPYETETGLMYRSGMGADHGMLFVFSDVAMHSFYMKNTAFPLDIIFVDENLRVAHIRENTVPHDETGIPSTVPIKYVLEVNAGSTQKWSLETGDRISYKKQ